MVESDEMYRSGQSINGPLKFSFYTVRQGTTEAKKTEDLRAQSP